MSAEDLAEQLKVLRVRAGNPSIRELEFLTARQGPARALSRSTLQEKISGRSLPRLGQVLTIVRACADYAKSIGAPLEPSDTDEQVWRERVGTASARTASPSPSAPAAATASAVRADVTEGRSPTWDLAPLLRAGMDDIVELIRTSEGQLMASWFQPVISALNDAEMSDEQFVEAASVEHYSDVVESFFVLADHYQEDALSRLMYRTSHNQPVDSIPRILALLRRKNHEVGPELADQLIGILSGEEDETYVYDLRKDVSAVVPALQAATMLKDVARLIRGIGKHGETDTILHFGISTTIPGARELVLNSVPEGGNEHLGSVLHDLRRIKMEDRYREELIDEILYGITDGNHDTTASYLKSEGLQEEAQRCLDLKPAATS